MSSEDVSENKPTPDTSRKPDSHCENTCKTEKNWWDKCKPFVELVGIGLLAVYTAYTIKMYCANNRAANAASSAAETAKQALVTGQRPWLGPKANPTVIFDNAGHPQSMELTMKNFGPSPALHVGVGPNPLEAFPERSFASLDEIVKASKSSCQWAEMASMKIPTVPTGIAIFPNGDATIFGKWSNGVTPDDAFLILGCVTYYDQLPDTPLHHTAFCFRSYRPLREIEQPGIDWGKYLFQCNVATQVD